MKGCFIVLEGGDGAGKSLVARHLKERMEVVWTREPGGTPVAEKIREILLDPQIDSMDSCCEALLYAASRAEHVARVIRPALEEGKMVLCERFVLSSLAYQGVGRGLEIDPVYTVNQWATRSLRPDLTLFFEATPQQVLDRKKKEGMLDRLEKEGLSFHDSVYQGYQRALAWMEADGRENVHRIDATQSPEEVIEEAWQCINKLGR